MTHAVRFLRPAGGLLAAGFLVPLLFFPPAGQPFKDSIPPVPASPADADRPATETAIPSEVPPPTDVDLSTPIPTETSTDDEVFPSPTPMSPGTEAPATLETFTPTVAPSFTPTGTLEPVDPSLTPSESPIATSTDTPTATLPVGPGPTPFGPMAVLINEVAWPGTGASSNDEWIELFNPGPSPIDLSGWRLTDGGDVHIALRGSIPGYGLFLLERTDDTTVLDLAADQIYTGGLSNSGESLELLDFSGSVIDTANAAGGGWPAGDVTSHASMERLAGADGPGAWRTFTGCWSTGVDAKGAPVAGTPRHPNSVPCLSATASPTSSEFSATPTATLTLTSTPSPQPTPAAPRSILINEVAWGGTIADSSDEWIELHNPGPDPIDLHGWRLTDEGDLQVSLRGTLAPYGFFLLERTDDQPVADLAADQIYTGGLNNDGESLWLLDPAGTVIDSANGDGGGWPAGNGAARDSMERRGGDDRSGNWGTFPGFGGVGHDSSGNQIRGTPRQPNAVNLPAPTATSIPSRVVINEVLIRPHYDWEGAGGVSSADEFIELYNAGDLPVHLLGWTLDDIEGAGSKPYTLPDSVLPAHGFLAYFRSRTHLALNDTGDTVRLLGPSGRVIDQISYLKVRASNLSYGRLPNGGHHLFYGLWPTAGLPNILFVQPRLPPPIEDTFTCPAGHLHPLLVRLPLGALARLHASTPLLTCP
jgi:hypothetical protein